MTQPVLLESLNDTDIPEKFNPCVMFLKSVFEELTEQEHLSSHLCWPAEFSYFGKNPPNPIPRCPESMHMS